MDCAADCWDEEVVDVENESTGLKKGIEEGRTGTTGIYIGSEGSGVGGG